jgi:hypothetical protein
MKFIDISDRPFWRLSNGEINWVMYHLDTWSQFGCLESMDTANLIGFELEEEAIERNQL